ncbi:MAG TPA: HNH endonuclease [Cyanobacteria bacterium UBA11149]|nr:HNH endonuclease [Cyanobacteria bacterium UBA11367]HBE59150.1 HNH endonuclease [Cyanobacteria bacterium UBA11366]HBR75699.1 HNH endonuclease [Cyanobacteria bacterium UBA11159]HBS69677.1 HNH endonuclease [Cyanobacteria bacterium UBA11153]HBW88460.1 HNH endonuclease [Cyanobacteria bacterium UBA11149]HCA93784.1 HNH endonuclease [Cyanobacteria bacterium UBA9226]
MSKQPNYAFVLDTNRKPLTPCKPSIARKLINAGKAKVFRLYPFTIILNKEVVDTPEPLTLKIDPGSKITGLAILSGSSLLWVAELTHRGQTIKAALESRRSIRRNRRNRHTRYRQARFLNRTRSSSWLAPSLQHRVETILTWIKKLTRYAPINAVDQELVRFDLQQLENPEISGIEYQQDELAGYEVREYLLNKWERKCAYCGIENIPLQIEHIHPKAKGGTNRISNLCLACEPCNIKKGTKNIEEFLQKKPEILKKVLAQAKRPLKDTAAVNSTRWALFNRLKKTGLEVATGSGGLTKFNRTHLQLPKTHFFDAACVGDTPELLVLANQPLLIKATGHGSRQMCRTDKFGFPSRYVPQFKFVKGFQTGDIVKAIVTSGKKIGAYTGRIALRSTGSFNISTTSGLIQGISYKYCQQIHQKDGYGYGF